MEGPEIQAVTFDAGGTLLEPWPSVGHVYAAVAAEFGFGEISPAVINRSFALAWQAKKDFTYSRAAWRELVDATFATLIPGPPSWEFFDALYQRFASAKAWRVFEDVRPALTTLKKRRLKLAVISNWDERLRPLLEQLDLARHFDVTVLSIETGFAKPAPEIFARAVTLLGVPPQSVLHFGDSAAEDLHGAHGAGMRAVLVDRRSAQPQEAMIGTLSDIPSVLGRLEAMGGLD